MYSKMLDHCKTKINRFSILIDVAKQNRIRITMALHAFQSAYWSIVPLWFRSASPFRFDSGLRNIRAYDEGKFNPSQSFYIANLRLGTRDLLITIVLGRHLITQPLAGLLRHIRLYNQEWLFVRARWWFGSVVSLIMPKKENSASD